MRISFGHGGWVAVDEIIGLPGRLYVRLRESDGRLRAHEVYLDASTGSEPIERADLRDIPLSNIEAVVNSEARQLLAQIDLPAPDLSTLASHFATTFNFAKGIEIMNWVAISFASQVDDEIRPVRRARASRMAPRFDDAEFRLQRGPTDGLTDGFLRDLARAYAAAVARGERPNVSIAEQVGYPLKTVQRWVYTARQRGIMPRGSKGKPG